VLLSIKVLVILVLFDFNPNSPYLLDPLAKTSPLFVRSIVKPSPKTIFTTFLDISSFEFFISNLHGLTIFFLISPSPNWP